MEIKLKNNTLLVSWLKWPLLVFVALFIVVNYYAFTEVALSLLNDVNGIAKAYGYNFDITKPFLFVLNVVVPSLGVIGYVATMTGKNVFSRIQSIYDTITITQLIILTVLLPALLFFQNKIYSKILSNGTK